MAASPARTNRSYVTQFDPSFEDRAGYFSAVDSSAPRIPGAKRFDNRPLAPAPGPGQYSVGADGTPQRSIGGVIGSAGRYDVKGEKFLSRQFADESPGPAAYTVSLDRRHASGTFPKAQRQGMSPPHVATAGYVGPGSYTPEPASPNRLSGPSTFSRARRDTRGPVMEGSPGPGYYAPPVTRPVTKGGTFSKSQRSSGLVPGGATPGSGAYNTSTFSTLSTRGSAIPRTGRSNFSLSPRVGDTGPGPGSYTPIPAASSGYVRAR